MRVTTKNIPRTVKAGIAVLIALFAWNCSVAQVKNDWTRRGLKGKVKVVTESFYATDSVGGKLQLNFAASDSFDQNGNRLLAKFYDSGRVVRIRSVFRVDENGDNIKYNYDETGALTSKTVRKFDKKGNVIERYYYGSSGRLIKKTFYKYDNDNNRIEDATYNSNGSLEEKNIDKYDAKGKLIEEDAYRDSGIASGRNVYQYDEAGNRVGTLSYNKDGVLEEESTSKYDEKNRLIYSYYIRKYDAEKHAPEESTYEYDSNGNCTKDVKYYLLHGVKR